MRISDWSSDVCSSDLSKADARTVRISINACYGPALPVSARRNAGSARQIGGPAISPVRRRVILQELPPHVLAAVEAVDDRVDDARGAVDDVQRRGEAFLDELGGGRSAERRVGKEFVRTGGVGWWTCN